MSEKHYWKGLTSNESAQNSSQDDREFGEDLPALNGITESISTSAQTGRRDFLKMLGFSVSAAAFAASCEMPVKKSIPYIFKPEDITPGQANYYSSAYVNGGDFVSVLVKTREGRPIMIEGNKLSSVSQGGTHAQAVASVLNVYNTGRIRGPKKGKESSTWSTIDSEITSKLQAAAGGRIVILTSTVISPTTKAAIKEFIAKYPSAEHIQYDAVSYDGILDANQRTFGIRAIPNYRFTEANVVVGISADFMGTWLSPVEFAADYSKRRKVSKESSDMSKHYQIESMATLSGSNADTRIPVKPSEEILSVIALYNLVAAKAGQSAVTSAGYDNKALAQVADDLWANKGKSLVVCGINNADVQSLVNGINNMLGNYGTTINWDRPSYQKQGNSEAVASLVNAMGSGSVKALLIAECNPAYSLPNADKFKDGLSKVGLSVYFGDRNNETSELVQYNAPTHHYLEAWNDAEPKAGIIATAQPTIKHLFDTRQWQQSLLKWAGNDSDYYSYMRTNWETSILPNQTKYSSFLTLWDNTVQDGEIVCNAPQTVQVSNFDGMANAATAAKALVAKKGQTELKLYEKVGIGNGHTTDNPWLLEMPDPITKITWENYLVTGVSDEKYHQDTDMKVFKVAKISVGGKELKLPVVSLPGVPAGVFALAYGFGRTVTNNPQFNYGSNVYSLLNANLYDVTVTPTGETVKLGCTQTHHTLTHKGLGGVKTRHTVKETTLADYKKNPESGNIIDEEPRKEWIEKHLKTLYPGHPYPGHHWKMVIDLNSCIGCGSCVVACTAENNIPVVGREEVIRSREMHWLRIDKYYTGSPENPQVIFQPMLCQHCDNAPCENVCPVAATNHSTEGINQMAYNRCIGTRYCANNCPYKVRRFNWFDYQGQDSFDSKTLFVENYDDTLGMQDPLVRMVLNPDVNVRGRGVIEKCSMCTQRIQGGKLEAKKAGRTLEDGDIVTACQSVCPTNAISFGDFNNAESHVRAMVEDDRTFGVIEEIHTLPNVLYMTKVRNKAAIEEDSFPESLNM